MRKPIIRKYGAGPEAKIQQEVIKFLTLRQWFVKVLHGNAYQQGMPDLFACKRGIGYRFIECKQPEKYMFTPSQMDTFPVLSAAGVGIWIMNAATEHEYQKLFYPPNWWTYLHETKVRARKEPLVVPPKPRGPEAAIQAQVIQALEEQGWFCKELHGDLYQYGMPDIFACKKGTGWRFIEIKDPDGYCFTAAQYETFPRLQAEGIGVWILTSPYHIDRLSKPPNWHHYIDGAK